MCIRDRDELIQTSRDLPAGWNRNGLEPNRKMIADFATELHAQQLADRVMTPAELFPHAS